MHHGVTEGEGKEQEIGNLFEKIIRENFPNLVKETDMKGQKAQVVPNKMDVKMTTPKYIIIKMPTVKDKMRILKMVGKKQIITYKGIPIRLSADFSKEALQARRD